jgi:hypothetical protein
MQDLWRKTVQTLKDFPALLFTSVGASLTSYFLHWFNRIYPRRIFRWLATGHSVLGFETQSPDSWGVIQKKAILLSAPVSLCLNMTIAGAYVAGFVLTSRLVRDLVQGQRPDLPAAFVFLRARILRVILFAAAILVAIGVGTFLTIELLNLQSFAALNVSIWFDTQVTISEVVLGSCIAWVLIPFSLRLIADPRSQHFPRKSKTQGRIAAIAAIVITFALNEFSTSLTPSINSAFATEAWLRRFVIWPGVSALLDLPLLFLWVFLGLLAYQDLQVPEIPSPS